MRTGKRLTNAADKNARNVKGGQRLTTRCLPIERRIYSYTESTKEDGRDFDAGAEEHAQEKDVAGYGYVWTSEDTESRIAG